MVETTKSTTDKPFVIIIRDGGVSVSEAYRVVGINNITYIHLVKPILGPAILDPPIETFRIGRREIIPLAELQRLYQFVQMQHEQDPTIGKRRTRVEFNLPTEILIYKL